MKAATRSHHEASGDAGDIETSGLTPITEESDGFGQFREHRLVGHLLPLYRQSEVVEDVVTIIARRWLGW